MFEELSAEQRRQVEILELFAEQMTWAPLKALVATSESSPEMIGGKPRRKLFGFGVYRSFETHAAFQWRREAKEQRELDEMARQRRKGRAHRARNLEACRAANRVNERRRYSRLTDEQYQRILASNRESKRRKRLAERQAKNLEAWKSSPRPKTKARLRAAPTTPETAKAEKRRAQRAAQAQRRRDRMTPEQRQVESAKASARKQR
jgi:hypothetical protein